MSTYFCKLVVFTRVSLELEKPSFQARRDDFEEPAVS
jgi:hypothetical protein